MIIWSARHVLSYWARVPDQYTLEGGQSDHVVKFTPIFLFPTISTHVLSESDSSGYMYRVYIHLGLPVSRIRNKDFEASIFRLA